MYFKPSTNIEVLNQINQLNTSKGCGYDSISTKFLKTATKAHSRILGHLFNVCFKLGIFPLSLKIVKVVPVYKNGDKTNSTNYIPIPILPWISKLIEQIICSIELPSF